MESFNSWLDSHYADYLSALTRVEKTRTLLLSGDLEQAGRVLNHSYVFAVLSIKTPLERHEQAFSGLQSGGLDLEEAAAKTVYGNQKARWISKTNAGTEWESLAAAVRTHVGSQRYETLLDSVSDSLTGVSHRKGSFMLAMSGLYEFICIDSHVAEFAGYEESDDGPTLTFKDAEEYLEASDEVVSALDTEYPLPPFLLQWAIYDYMRGEHARHMAFYHEVLPEVLWRD
jgi:hypothetical protein